MIPFGFLGKEAAPPAGGPPTVIGYSTVDSTSTTPSGSVTVPSDATFGVMFCWTWTTSADATFSAVTLGTGGGQINFAEDYTAFNSGGGDHSESIFSADVSSLAGGSETLAGTRAATISDGGTVLIVWVKGEAATTPVIDATGLSTPYETTDVSISIDSTTNSTVIAMGGAYGIDPILPTGFTQLGSIHTYNGNRHMICYRTGLTTSTDAEQTVDGWPGILGISIEGT